jgi:hypothetical protein
MPTSIRFSSFGLAIAVCALSGVALAGQSAPQYVYVGSNWAGGSLNAARYSGDDVQGIACQTTGSTGSSPTLWCWAMDSRGNYAGCQTSDAGLVAVASRINSAAYFYFVFDANSDCTAISVENGSQYLQ